MDSPTASVSTMQKSGTLMTVIEESKSSVTETDSSRRKSVQMSKDIPSRRKDSGPRTIDSVSQKSAKWTAARRVSMMSNFSTSSRRFEPTPEPQRAVPPTYRLHPKEEEEFHWWKAKPLIQDLLSVYSSDLTYNAKGCARQCLVLADMVKNKMKMLGCSRHKLVVTVDIGENKGQAVTLASRCCWDTKTDNSLHIQHKEEISKIFTVYHSAIRKAAGLEHLTNRQIDLVLKQILEEPTPAMPLAPLRRLLRQKRSTAVSETEPDQPEATELECAPRPQLIYQDEIKNMVPHSASHFLRMSISDPRVCSLSVPCYAIELHRCPHTTRLHCDASNSSCLVKETELVALDVRRESSIQTVNFVNHTECECARPRKRCVCPWPYNSVPTLSSEFQCQCQCADGEEQLCQQIQSGNRRLQWNETRLSNKSLNAIDYEICRNITEDSTWRHSRHPDDISYCPPVPCDSELAFHAARLQCMTNESPLGRGARQSSAIYNQTTSPQQINRLTLQRRIERKLDEIHEEGLEQSTSRIGRKLYEAFEDQQRDLAEGDVSPSDISIALKYSRDVEVSCKVVPSQYHYVLPTRSHVLFCGIEIQ